MALNINGTTGISGVDGSVAAPALTGTDSNTGITFPSADTIKFSTGGVERMSITNSGVTGTGIGAGKILQVVQAVKTDTSSTTSATYTDISGLSLSITPASNSNKILVTCNVYVGGDDNSFQGFKVFRDSTAIGLGTAATGNQSNVSFANFMTNVSSSAYGVRNVCFEFLDSPSSTSSLTYKIQFASTFNSVISYINRGHIFSQNFAYNLFPSSTITAREVAA